MPGPSRATSRLGPGALAAVAALLAVAFSGCLQGDTTPTEPTFSTGMQGAPGRGASGVGPVTGSFVPAPPRGSSPTFTPSEAGTTAPETASTTSGPGTVYIWVPIISPPAEPAATGTPTTDPTSSDSSTTGDAANAPPTAHLAAAPRSGVAPLAVTFTVEASDAEGDPIFWSLDVDNDTAPEISGGGAELPAEVDWTYAEPGTYTAMLRVEAGTGWAWWAVDVTVEAPAETTQEPTATQTSSEETSEPTASEPTDEPTTESSQEGGFLFWRDRDEGEKADKGEDDGESDDD